jgi:hypothetical protein
MCQHGTLAPGVFRHSEMERRGNTPSPQHPLRSKGLGQALQIERQMPRSTLDSMADLARRTGMPGW